MGKCIQLKLWEDCHNGCSFCYLNSDRINTTVEEKKSRLKYSLDLLRSTDLSEYDRLGLIGGDFFLGELNGLEQDWFMFLDTLSTFPFTQIWLASALTQSDPGLLLESLSHISQNVLICLICTSYDTVGRFTPDSRELWFSNVNMLISRGHNVHITCIPTKDFIREYHKGMFPEQCHVNLCEPHLGTTWYGAVDKEHYHTHMVRENHLFNLPTRNEFLAFLTHNKDILRNYTDYFKSHSDRIVDLDDHISSSIRTDRMDSSNHHANDICGHPYFNHFYSDSDRCAMCDALMLRETNL